MIKPLVVIQGPVATRSGYGNHTRDIARSLIAMDKYDLKIISMRWGHCPMTALNELDPKDKPIIDCIVNDKFDRQPDIFIQISVPNEFCMAPDGKTEVRPGKFNIGITAGVESNVMPADCIQGCNRMDLVITTSKHTSTIIKQTVWDKVNEQTKQKEDELKITTPIEELFEGADLDVYKKVHELDKPVVDELAQLKESFCFLVVGHWIKGDIGEDRKDIGMTIKTFLETFKNTGTSKRPGLILKVSGATFSIIDRDMLMAKIASILKGYGNNAPNVYLLHGDLSDAEMNSLYNHPKVKAMVSFTKGEGFGRPLLEFSLTGKPIIVSNWSGHLDFLHNEYTTLLPGQLTQVHPSAADRFIMKESKWFTVQYQYASKILKDVFKHYKKYLERSRKQGYYSRTNFSLEKMTEKFTEILGKYAQPERVELTLPKLNNSGQNDSPPKIKLPKLKKVNV
jgi:glycosyltransferase involved in cell wall biosynthesis